MVLQNRPRPTCLQVGHLPWRVDAKGRTRLLLITSGKNKRWMLPKGLTMPGMALREASSIDALVEAGCFRLLSDGGERPAEAVVFHFGSPSFAIDGARVIGATAGGLASGVLGQRCSREI